MTQDLIEVLPFEYSITESKNGKFRVEGVFQRSDVENANKRVYPRSIWEKVTNDKNIMETMSGRSMFGELDHPADGKTKLQRVSHIVTDLKLAPDGTVTGVAEVLNTPHGEILKTLFESGTRVGISSRGSGSVNNGIVGEDFKLNTFDFVARPSTPGAIPSPSVARRGRWEDVEDNLTAVPYAEDADDDYDLSSDPDYQEFLKALDSGDDNYVAEAIDFGSFSHDVIAVHNWLRENASFLQEDTLAEAAEAVVALGETASELVTAHPEYKTVMDDLMQKIEECNGFVYKLYEDEQPEEIKEDDEMNKQFIRERLLEAADTAVLEEEQELEAFVEELDKLDDDELLALAVQNGVIDPEELGMVEDDEEDEDEMLYDDDLENVAEYVAVLEDRLETAHELIEALAGTLEEETVEESDLALKYEAALGIIQETVSQYQFLQEAVGGSEKAEAIMENYLSHLENAMDDEASGDVTEDFDMESYIDEAYGGGHGQEMSRNVELAESALQKLGLN